MTRRAARMAHWAIVLALATLLLPRPSSAAPPAPATTLTLGVFVQEDPDSQRRRLEPLVRHLDAQLAGVQLELPLLDVAGMEAALAANQLDLVLTHPGHYLALRSHNALTGALATMVRRHGDLSTSSLGGVIVVRADSPIRRLSDLKGRRVAANASMGVGGWQAQAMELLQAGLDPHADLDVRWMPGPRSGIDSLVMGVVDAAFVRTGLLEDAEAMAGLDPAQLRVVNPQRLAGYPYQVSTRLYPEWPLLALPHVDARLVRRIAAAVLALEPDDAALRAAGIAGFDPPADYLPVELLARAVRAAPFDAPPQLRLADLWDSEREWLLAGAAALAVIVGLAVLVSHRNRQLARGNRDLARSRRLLQAVIDTVPVQVYWKDRDGRVLGHNQGGGAAESVAPGTASLLPDEAVVLAGGVPQLNVEAAFQRPDGGSGWQRRSTVPLRDDEGAVMGVLGTVDDISEFKRQQLELLAARNQLQATIDAVPDLLFEVDEDGTYLSVHAHQSGLLAAPLAQLLGRRIADVLPPEAAAACRQAMDAARDRGHSQGHAYQLQLADGAHWFELSAAVKRGAAGEPLRFVAISRDITDRRQALDELQAHRHRLEDLVARRTAELSSARDAAERASQAKSVFLANMSHEIRTPLNAVIGMGHLLRRSPLNAQQRGWLDTLSASGEHLLEVLNAILDLSRIEAGKLPLSPAPTDLRTLLADAHSMVRQRAVDKGLRLSVELPDAVPQVLADATRLRQALLNLLHNAIKFTPAGEVRVVLRVDDDEGDDDQVLARFEVHDTGIGVEPDVLPRLFASFEQADNSSTRSFGGTGLGLAITRRLALQMGGDAGASSTPGVGSLFWFSARLRRHQGPVVDEPLASGAGQLEHRLRTERAGRCVLLVEDDPINREVTTELLTFAGQRVVIAEDGIGAVARVDAGGIDLVLMDMQMPRLDGLGATRRIRASAAGAALPIVALTANAFAEDRARCLAAGMNDFLGKPLDMADLVAVLWRWLP